MDIFKYENCGYKISKNILVKDILNDNSNIS